MKRFLLTLAFLSVLPAQPYSAPLTWTWTGRVHPELDWYTISTDNFNVHYHQELDEIARQGAIIAENVLPTLLKQCRPHSRWAVWRWQRSLKKPALFLKKHRNFQKRMMARTNIGQTLRTGCWSCCLPLRKSNDFFLCNVE